MFTLNFNDTKQRYCRSHRIMSHQLSRFFFSSSAQVERTACSEILTGMFSFINNTKKTQICIIYTAQDNCIIANCVMSRDAPIEQPGTGLGQLSAFSPWTGDRLVSLTYFRFWDVPFCATRYTRNGAANNNLTDTRTLSQVWLAWRFFVEWRKHKACNS